MLKNLPSLLNLVCVFFKNKATEKNLFIFRLIRIIKLPENMIVGNTKMPDAMEIIFQAALTLGIRGGVS